MWSRQEGGQAKAGDNMSGGTWMGRPRQHSLGEVPDRGLVWFNSQDSSFLLEVSDAEWILLISVCVCSCACGHAHGS